MEKLIVGIDFGTSTTVVRYKKEGTDNILPVKDQNGTSDYIPSAIFRMEDGQQSLYGHAALNAKQGGMKGELITNFKMGLLDADEQTQRQKKAYIEEFLVYVYQCFSKETKGLVFDCLDVYVSYPAKWSDSFVEFMKQAVGKAGFGGNVYGINEPKAATYNIMHRHLPDLQKSKLLTDGKPLNVFMLDMGAGTTDIVIFRLCIDKNQKIEIDQLLSYPSVDNPFLCGGREIDDILSQYVLNYISEQTGLEELDEDFFPMDTSKFWKDQVLSPSLTKGVAVPMPPTLQSALKYMPNGKKALQSFLMTRTAFENATTNHWERLYQLISSAINLYHSKFGVGAEDIDLLFLTGGHSQWYTVPNLFNGKGVNGRIGIDYQTVNSAVKAQHFTKLEYDSWRTFADALPHECVAVGLCLQDQNLKVVDVCANNMWVNVLLHDQKSEPKQVAEIGQLLPIEFSFSPRATLNKGALEKSVFDVSIEIYSGSDLSKAQKSVMKQTVDNDYGRWFANILLLGLPILFGGYDTTIEVPLKVRIEQDNSVNIDGYILYANGRDVPTEKMSKLVDQNNQVVRITKAMMKYE